MTEPVAPAPADYERVNRTRDLAGLEAVRLALVGTVSGYEAGPDMFANDNSDKTLLLNVAPLTVFDGEAPDEGRVQVLMSVGLTATPDTMEQFAATGSKIVLYLNPVVKLPPDFANRRLFVPVSPQGLVVGDAVTSTYPLDPSLNTSESLSEQVPPSVEVG